MKSSTTQLINFLRDSEQMAMADLFALKTLSGWTYYTSADIDIPFNSNNYSSVGPLITRDNVRLVRGLEVDTMKLNIAASPDMLIEGLPFIQAALGGALDNARFILRRVFMADWGGAIQGSTILFEGRVSGVTGSRNNVKVEVMSDLELLTTELPRDRFQANCTHTVFGPGCGVQRASYLVNSSATAGSTVSSVNSGLAQAASYFNQGVLEWTSGPNNKLRRTVKSYSGGTFKFALPLPFAPGVGDTFKVLPGCDKTQNTCFTKFNNLARRKGYPFVPAAETIF